MSFMVKKYEKESDKTILIVMIITFLVCSSLLLFIINYLDQLYKITEDNRLSQEGLGSINLFYNAGNPIFRSKDILEARFGIYGTLLFFDLILLLIVSGIYLFLKIKKKINDSINKEDESRKINISVRNR